MSRDNNNPLFLYTEEEKAEIRKAFGLTETSIREGIDSILDWFNKQPHLVDAGISRETVEMMIIISKGSIERSKEKIDNYYKYRSLMPEIINDRRSILNSSDSIWNMFVIAPIPRLLDNRRIFIVKFGQHEDKFDIVDVYRRALMLLDLRMKHDYMVGDIWVIDMKHVGWMQIMSQNPMVFKKISQLFTKALNWRLFGIHVINIKASPSIVQRVLDFFNQLINSQIMNRVVIHDTLEDLYKFIPKESLPEDYGGNGPSLEKYAEIGDSVIKSPKTVEFLLECTKLVSNENLRPRDENSEDFLPGSFRKLEVD